MPDIHLGWVPWFLLGLWVGMLVCSELGYVYGRRMSLAQAGSEGSGGAIEASIFAFMIVTATVYVILDLEFPRRGLIRLDTADQLLVELQKSID